MSLLTTRVAPFRSKSAPLFSNFRDLAPPNIVNYIVFSNYDLYRKTNFAHIFLFSSVLDRRPKSTAIAEDFRPMAMVAEV